MHLKRTLTKINLKLFGQMWLKEHFHWSDFFVKQAYIPNPLIFLIFQLFSLPKISLIPQHNILKESCEQNPIL